MHAAFIPYGKRSEVEILLRDMESQKHRLVMEKNNKKQVIWIQGAVRQLPLGIYEYIFPKEDMDMVLTTLNFTNNKGLDNYLSTIKLSLLRKFFKYKRAPEFNSDKRYLWVDNNVAIIPIGIKEDKILEEKSGQYAGWEHEAL